MTAPSSKLRVGVLGAARILEKYVAAALAACPDTELAGIAARDASRAKALGERFRRASFDSYEALLSSPDIDAVYIPLPISLHEPWALRAIAAGKHALVEKSFTDSLAGAERVVAAAEKAGVLVAENFMCAFHPQHAAVRAELAAGRIGTPKTFHASFGIPALAPTDIRYSRELGGGALGDLGAYTLFMGRFLFGEDAEIHSASLTVGPSGVDELGTVHARFGSVQATLEFGLGLEYRNEYRVWGSGGLIHVGRAFSIPPDMAPPVTVRVANTDTALALPAADHFIHALADFAARVRNKRFADAHAGVLAQARLLDAVRRASATSQR
jgi:NDP-hexose-3-ketoreductase